MGVRIVSCSQFLIVQRYAYSASLKFVSKSSLKCCPALISFRRYSSFTPDTIDIFTDKLVKDMVNKWNCNRLQKKKQTLPENTFLNYLPKDKVCANDLFLETLANADSESCKHFISAALKDNGHSSVIIFLNFCCKRKRVLPPECLLEAASSFSRVGIVDGVKAVKMLCKETNQYEYAIQGGYDHYLAEATWKSGNLQEALDLFARVYEHCPNLRKKIRSLSRFLICDVISRQGEASLVLLTRFVRNFASQYQDYHFLMVLWQFCFLSDWFADQTLASNLLKEHPELLSSVKERAVEFSFILLKSYRSEIVYRLLEVLLLYKMKDAYIQVLRALFDDKCDQRDVQACCNIVRCCEHLEVTLTASQQQKFIHLIVSEHPVKRQSLQTAKRQQCSLPPEFKLKF